MGVVITNKKSIHIRLVTGKTIFLLGACLTSLLMTLIPLHLLAGTLNGTNSIPWSDDFEREYYPNQPLIDGAHYTLGLIPLTQGAVYVTIPTGVAHDGIGNANVEALPFTHMPASTFLRTYQLPPPGGVAVTAGIYTNKARVSWFSATGATGYEVWRHTANDSAGAVRLAATSATVYDDASVTIGTLYYYWVKSLNAIGVSTFSTGASGFCAVPVPAGFAATKGVFLNKVFIRWSSVPGAVSYELWRAPVNDSAAAARLMDAAVVNYTDFGVVPGVNYYYWVRSKSPSGRLSVLSSADNGRRRAGDTDFDGDGLADPAVYHEGSGLWCVLFSSLGYASVVIPGGVAGAIPVVGDYDGDGKADPGAYVPSTGLWAVQRSRHGYALTSTVLGGAGYWATPSDYDSDGCMDPAVYNQATGVWTLLLSSRRYVSASAMMGGGNFLPEPGDYDGDGKVDIAVYLMPAGAWGGSGVWYAMLSMNYTLVSALYGSSAQVPVPGDYDGDGKADPTLYQESGDFWGREGLWMFMMSASGYSRATVALGGREYIPVPADYDGDGITDFAVYQSATGQWVVMMSSHPGALGSVMWGGPGFVPATGRR